MTSIDLNADCASCTAVCCVAFELERSPAFAIDKAAGERCPNLSANRCAIHSELNERGFSGCAQFDCHGAGPRAKGDMSVFFVLLEYHELLWAISRVLLLFPHANELLRAREELERESCERPLSSARRDEVHALLRERLRYKRTR